MSEVFNFSAGPAVLPHEVLSLAADEMHDWHGSGMSVMEMSHRGPEFEAIIAEAEADLRTLLAVPAGYKVLFLQGGAMLQFAMVPMNLMREHGTADYVDTGVWGRKAIAEAGKCGMVRVAASAAEGGYTGVPPQSSWRCDPHAAYLHITSNETIGGVEFHWLPDTGAVPLVADASSHILSRPMDISRCGLIYAGAQKNIGPAGLTIVIIRDDLLGHAPPGTPMTLDYQAMADSGSMLNTPPTFAIYMAGLVFRWLLGLGGLAEMERRNRAKAALLYDLIDASDFYSNPVDPADRSLMNVPFRLADDALDGAFLAAARERHLLQLQGHRSAGGMRASIYNAMPLEGVRTLAAFMHDFERTHG